MIATVHTLQMRLIMALCHEAEFTAESMGNSRAWILGDSCNMGSDEIGSTVSVKTEFTS